MTKDAPTDAACGAPNNAGSASGLRNSPCSAAPAKPNVAADQDREQRTRQSDIAHDDAAAPSPLNRPASASRGESAAGADHQRDDGEHRDQHRERQIEAQSRSVRHASSVLRRPSYKASGLPSNRFAALSPATEVRCCIVTRIRMLALRCSPFVPMQAVAADPPRRIASFNVCADQLVVALADPDQIVALSPNARDPAISVVTEKASRYPLLGRTAEAMVPLKPDLVLVGPWDRPLTQRHAARSWLPDRQRRYRERPCDRDRADPRDCRAARASGTRRGADRGDRSRAATAGRGAAAKVIERACWSAIADTPSVPTALPAR